MYSPMSSKEYAQLTGTQTDHGDHRAPMLGGIAAQNIMYSSASNPIELTDNVDLEFIKTRVSHSPMS